MADIRVVTDESRDVKSAIFRIARYSVLSDIPYWAQETAGVASCASFGSRHLACNLAKRQAIMNQNICALFQFCSPTHSSSVSVGCPPSFSKPFTEPFKVSLVLMWPTWMLFLEAHTLLPPLANGNDDVSTVHSRSVFLNRRAARGSPGINN
jgi:hypothetical protein